MQIREDEERGAIKKNSFHFKQVKGTERIDMRQKKNIKLQFRKKERNKQTNKMRGNLRKREK